MSVDVKTPTRTQFEHPEFPCGDRRSLSVGDYSQTLVSRDNSQQDTRAEVVKKSHSQDSYDGEQGAARRDRSGSFSRKRRYNDKSGPGNGTAPFNPKRRTSNRRNSEKEKIILPTKFLLGGNITDPLNLNSLCDEEVNRALNENTPQSSPLPVPMHKKQEVKVLIPPNINDPLNLNTGEDVESSLLSPKTKKKKKAHKKRKSGEGLPGPSGDEGATQQTTEEPSVPVDITKPITVEIGDHTEDVQHPNSFPESLENKMNRIIDKIVSPVIPQISPKAKRRKRTSSECKPEPSTSATRALLKEDSSKPAKNDKPTHKPRCRRQSSSQSSSQQSKPKPQRGDKFIYGNYNRYYGYRNSEIDTDPRLECLKREWFDGKDALDIGCNVGHMTLTIAQNLHPNKIVGIDIDHSLISAAKKNVRHYLAKSVTNTSRFPASLPLTYGPLATKPAPIDATNKLPKLDFPNNIMFMQGNYVLERDDLVELQQEEYDIILCFSITKWIHLNFGDAGLKRAFRRMYRQLRPGGRLILEPQSFASYKKKKKINETIFRNFQSIRFKPDQFTEYLLSSAIGFSKCEKLEMPFQNKSKGFQRPVLVYTKPDTASATPYGWESRGVTPFANSTPGLTPGGHASTPYSAYTATPLSEMASPRGFTPRFEMSSAGVTPCSTCENTPVHIYSAPSANATPTKTEGSSLEATPQRDSNLSDHEVVSADHEQIPGVKVQALTVQEQASAVQEQGSAVQEQSPAVQEQAPDVKEQPPASQMEISADEPATIDQQAGNTSTTATAEPKINC